MAIVAYWALLIHYSDQEAVKVVVVAEGPSTLDFVLLPADRYHHQIASCWVSPSVKP
jgi:hypothetical protein